MLDNQLKEQLIVYLTKASRKTKEDRLNICAWVYNLATNNTKHTSDIVRFLLEQSDYINSDNSLDPELLFSSNDLTRLKKMYGKLVDSILETMLIKNPTEDAFYNNLWNCIIQTPALDSTESHIFALFYIWIDARIPYYHLPDGLFMSDQRFKELSKLQEHNISKARFIIHTNKFVSRTERAKVLLDLLDEIHKDEEKTVLMAHIMTLLSLSLSSDFRTVLQFLDNSDSEDDT